MMNRLKWFFEFCSYFSLASWLKVKKGSRVQLPHFRDLCYHRVVASMTDMAHLLETLSHTLLVVNPITTLGQQEYRDERLVLIHCLSPVYKKNIFSSPLFMTRLNIIIWPYDRATSKAMQTALFNHCVNLNSLSV